MISMAANKVVYAGKTLIDLTNDSVAPSFLQSGMTAHDKAGNTIVGTARLLSSALIVFTDVTIWPAAFVADSTYENYPYAAFIECQNVKDTHQPDIAFSRDTPQKCSIAKTAKSANGGIYIYAEDVPTESITISTIICWDTSFRIEYEDVVVSASSLCTDSDGWYVDLNLDGVTASMYPVVTFEVEDSLIAHVAETFDGGVRLFFDDAFYQDKMIKSIVLYNIDI